MKLKTIFIPLLSLFFISLAVAGPVKIYVDVNATGPIHNGTSWSNAYTKLQDALDDAASNNPAIPVTIFVAKGVYVPTKDINGNFPPLDPRDATFKIPNLVSLYGGFGGTTILSGDLSCSVTCNDITDRTDPNYVNSHLDNARHVVTANNVSFFMNGFTIYGGYDDLPSAGGGAGLLVTNGAGASVNTVTLEKMIFDDNFINGFGSINNGGGAVLITNPNIAPNNSLTFNVNQSIFSNNHAARLGGAMQVNNANSTFDQVTFDHNKTDIPPPPGGVAGAGAMRIMASVNGVESHMTHSSFTNNSAAGGAGGALVISEITASINHSNFTNNSGPGGGAIFIVTLSKVSNVEISFSKFIANHCTTNGGAVNLTALAGPASGRLTVEHSEFTDNTTTLAGGAIRLSVFDSANINYSTFKNNTAGTNGGAISSARAVNAPYSNSLTIDQSKFENNSLSGIPSNGGAIFDNEVLQMAVYNSDFTGNSANGNGGGIFLTDAGVPASNPVPTNRTITIIGSQFDNNRGSNAGAVGMIDQITTNPLTLETLVLNIEKSHFMNNVASLLGGALYQSRGNMNTTNSLFQNNNDSSLDQIVVQLPATTNSQSSSPAIENALVNANKLLNLDDVLVNP